MYVGTGVTVVKLYAENSGALLVLFLLPVVSLMLTALTVLFFDFFCAIEVSVREDVLSLS